jgi:GntR family transcriptional regulator
VPIFQQIASEIERLILIGEIKPDDLIPSVREFAVAHSVNPNTVAKSYSLLQANGLVEHVRGIGLRVLKQNSAQVQSRRRELLIAKAEELMKTALALGFSGADAIDAVQNLKPNISRGQHE